MSRFFMVCARRILHPVGSDPESGFARRASRLAGWLAIGTVGIVNAALAAGSLEPVPSSAAAGKERIVAHLRVLGTALYDDGTQGSTGPTGSSEVEHSMRGA